MSKIRNTAQSAREEEPGGRIILPMVRGGIGGIIPRIQEVLGITNFAKGVKWEKLKDKMNMRNLKKEKN